jgi:hypothetical protein
MGLEKIKITDVLRYPGNDLHEDVARFSQRCGVHA